MSLCFVAMALFCMGDLYMNPVSEIQYVLAHENETGYRGNGRKYGAYYFRDNYLYTIDFCANKPYRLRPNEVDTQLTYMSLEHRIEEATKQQNSDHRAKTELKMEKIPVDLKTYYALEDGDSIRLFFSPWRHKLKEYVTMETEGWDKLSDQRLLHYPLEHRDLEQWNLTTWVFCCIVLVLSAGTWLIKPFEFAVGLFVFNVIIVSLLNWVY